MEKSLDTMYVGGGSSIKCFNALLRALPRLISSGVRLRLIGNYKRVIKLPNVEFVGRVSHDYCGNIGMPVVCCFPR
jgi:hypothetical protein